MHSDQSDLVGLLEAVENRHRKELKPIYKRHGVAPNSGVKALAAEIRLDGSNSLASLFRGHEGVNYSEIVEDVAERLGVELEGELPLEQLERKLLGKLVESYIKSNKGQSAIESKVHREDVDNVIKAAGVDIDNQAFGEAIAKLAPAIIAQVVRAIIVRQLAKEGAKRAAALAGWAIPVINVIFAGWTVVDLAGPAYRKIVPTVLELSLLRMEHLRPDGNKDIWR